MHFWCARSAAGKPDAHKVAAVLAVAFTFLALTWGDNAPLARVILHQGDTIQSYPNPGANSSAFTEGTCCLSAVLDVHDKVAACKFMRSRSALLHAPGERPQEFGTTCLSYARDLPHGAPKTGATAPHFSVLVNVFNSQAKLRIVLTQLLKLTTEPWELILSFDGCTDDSYHVAVDLIERAFGKTGSDSTWPTCPYPMATVNTTAIWTSGLNLDSHQGDIGRECWFKNDLHDDQTAPLVSVKFLVTSGVGLFATASDNLKMLASRAPLYILVDDDQFMTTPRWNVKLAYPLRAWPRDVFSASARCAHGHPAIGEAFGPKCTNSLALQPQTAAKGRCAFYVMDSGNRGPLVMRAAYAHALGYLDELHYAGVLTTSDDHDLNWRAFYASPQPWVSGFLPLDYTEERNFRSAQSVNPALISTLKAYEKWFFKRKEADAYFTDRSAVAVSNSHNKILPIFDGSWDEACIAQRKQAYAPVNATLL